MCVFYNAESALFHRFFFCNHSRTQQSFVTNLIRTLARTEQNSFYFGVIIWYIWSNESHLSPKVEHMLRQEESYGCTEREMSHPQTDEWL